MKIKNIKIKHMIKIIYLTYDEQQLNNKIINKYAYCDAL